MWLLPVMLGILLPLAMPGNGSEAVDTPADTLESARKRALPVVKELMKTLEGRLREAMAEGGPVAAIRVCQEQALLLTGTVRQQGGVAYLKRVGVRVRNPQNAPDPDEVRALEHFLAAGGQAGSFPEDWVDTVELPDGSKQLRYYRAIPLQARCLPCHGPEDNMPPNLRSMIDKLYPDDAARGFELGELRGLMVVGMETEP